MVSQIAKYSQLGHITSQSPWETTIFFYQYLKIQKSIKIYMLWQVHLKLYDLTHLKHLLLSHFNLVITTFLFMWKGLHKRKISVIKKPFANVCAKVLWKREKDHFDTHIEKEGTLVINILFLMTPFWDSLLEQYECQQVIKQLNVFLLS